MTSHTPFQQVIESARQFGLPEVLSFLLLTLLSYGLLKRTKLFGDFDEDERGRKIAAGISVVISLFIFLSPFGQTVTAWFGDYFYQLLIALVGVFGLILLAGFSGIDFDSLWEKDEFKGVRNTFLWGGVLIGVIVFIAAGGFGIFTVFDVASPGDISSETVNDIIGAIIVILVFVFAMGAVMSGGKNED